MVLDVECDDPDAPDIDFAIHGIAQTFVRAAYTLQNTHRVPWRLMGASVLSPLQTPTRPSLN